MRIFFGRKLFFGSPPMSIILLTLWFLADNISSLTVDLASHYTLVKKIEADFFINSGYVLNLGEMADYPPISHYLAASFGKVFGSPLYGLSITATLSIIVFYLALFGFLKIKGLIPIIFISILSVFSAGLPFVGQEIVGGNFLFPQLVSLSLFTVFAYFTVNYKGRFTKRSAIILLLMYTLMLSVHPSVAAVCYLFVVLLFSSHLALKLPELSKKDFIPIIIFSVLGLIIFKLHPYTKFASAIKMHNGALGFDKLSIAAYDFHPAVYCMIFFALFYSFFNIVRALRRRKLNDVYFQLSLLILSFAGIAFLQAILFSFQLVSAYVVKKNLFGMFTFGVALLVVQLRDLLHERCSFIPQFLLSESNFFVRATGASVVCLALLYPPNHKVSEYLPVSTALDNFHAQSATSTSFRKTITNLDVPMGINWLFSLGDLGVYKWSPYSHAIVHNLQNELPDDAYLILDKQLLDTPFQLIGNNLFLYKYIDYNAPKVLKVDENAISLGAVSSGLNIYLKKGFSGYSDWGHWSIGRSSLVNFEVATPDRGKSLRIKLKLLGYINDKHTSCEFDIHINGIKMANIVIERNGPHDYFFDLPKDDFIFNVEFHNKNPVTPKSLGMSQDERELGFGISELIISEDR